MSKGSSLWPSTSSAAWTSCSTTPASVARSALWTAHRRRGLGLHIRRTDPRCVPRDQARRSGHAGVRRRRVDHQHRVDRRSERWRRPARLLGREGGSDQPHTVGGGRARTGPDPRERDLPGRVNTPLAAGRADAAAAAERFASLQPWPETGTGDHIAGAALFLASDNSQFVTGEALVVDGGLTALGPDLVQRMRLGGAGTPAVGVNRGTTGQGTTVRYRLQRDGQNI